MVGPDHVETQALVIAGSDVVKALLYEDVSETAEVVSNAVGIDTEYLVAGVGRALSRSTQERAEGFCQRHSQSRGGENVIAISFAPRSMRPRGTIGLSN
jgi:hypothetical protein